MVLLSGLNYDYSSQQNSDIISTIGAGSTTLKVKNTEGFSVDDYLVIEPRTEKSEIIKISAIVDNQTLTISAAKFNHLINAMVYRIPYNQMRFYYSTDITGTYTLITSSETELAYANIYTNYIYTAGTSALYYKRTFYNATTLVESDIAEADYWQTGDEELYVTPEEMRVLLQFDKNDPPSPEDMATLIKTAQKQILLDVDSSNQNILFLATYMLAKSYIFKALAAKSLSKGYITINVEGRNVTKAYQELVLEAENISEEYKAFVKNNTRTEVGKTNFMNDTTIIPAELRQAYIDNWVGTQNALDRENSSTRLYSRGRRLR